jgi:hypothetical protein
MKLLTKLRKSLLATLVGGIALVGIAGEAAAHATSIGYENAGVAGSVNIWLGTYEHGGHHLEGSMTLAGVNGTVFGPTTNSFTMLTCDGAACKPAGLIDGVTNFYAPDANIGGSDPLSGSEAGFLAGCPGCGPTNHWEGVTFTGLSAGDYQFTWVPIANPTLEWSPLNTNMNGIFTIGETVITGAVPEPEIYAMLGVGLGLMGWVGRRRKLQAA